MQDSTALIAVTSTAFIAVSVTSAVALKGWQDWLELKRLEMTGKPQEPSPPSATSRIEVADLKERVRKLEAIASGIDL